MKVFVLFSIVYIFAIVDKQVYVSCDEERVEEVNENKDEEDPSGVPEDLQRSDSFQRDLSHHAQYSVHSPAKYNFEWRVKHAPSKNDYGQTEKRDGDDITGAYYVALPDGRVQQVSYFVDPSSGYNAKIEYDGEVNEYVRDASSNHISSSYKPSNSKVPLRSSIDEYGGGLYTYRPIKRVESSKSSQKVVDTEDEDQLDSPSKSIDETTEQEEAVDQTTKSDEKLSFSLEDARKITVDPTKGKSTDASRAKRYSYKHLKTPPKPFIPKIWYINDQSTKVQNHKVTNSLKKRALSKTDEVEHKYSYKRGGNKSRDVKSKYLIKRHNKHPRTRRVHPKVENRYNYRMAQTKTNKRRNDNLGFAQALKQHIFG